MVGLGILNGIVQQVTAIDSATINHHHLKTFLKKYLPGNLFALFSKVRSSCRNAGLVFKDSEKIFSDIYRNRSWGGASLSGMGSDLQQTESLRRNFIPLLERYRIESILDLTCGDFHWMRQIDLGKRRYLGGDIVKDLILSNQQYFESDNRRFMTLDIMADDLPESDLLLCRDCLIHFSSSDILKTFRNIKNSKIHYLLTTNYPLINKNTDIITGDFRAINLQLPPFNLPNPLRSIQEDYFQEHKNNPNFIRELCLWKVADI